MRIGTISFARTEGCKSKYFIMSEEYQRGLNVNHTTGNYDEPKQNNGLIDGSHPSEMDLDTSDKEEALANPEMPVEMLDDNLENADTINDTVFSKHWTISVLLQLVEYVQDKELYEQFELEDGFHENLCKLWDISISEGVSIFLLENEFLDIFSACVEKSSCPRAVEIAVGTLANMSCVDSVCEAIEKSSQIMKIAVCLLQSPYPPILIETSRSEVMFTACDGTYKTSKPAAQLLEGTAELIDGMLVADDVICQKWSTPEFVGAIMEALIQLGPNIGESGKTFLHILQCVSTSEAGVQALATHSEKACKFAISYLKSICDEDFIIIDDKEPPIASALAILNATFSHWNGNQDFLCQEYTLLRCILKLAEVSPEVNKNTGDSDGGDSCSSLTNYIFELLISLLQDTLSVLLQVALKSLDQDKDAKIPKSLEYMETTCDAARLTFFRRSSTNHNSWLEIARSYKCTRLIDCLTSDINSLKMY